jgi:hypothetical protein
MLGFHLLLRLMFVLADNLRLLKFFRHQLFFILLYFIFLRVILDIFFSFFLGKVAAGAFQEVRNLFKVLNVLHRYDGTCPSMVSWS